MPPARTEWHRDPMATTTSLSRSSSRSCRGRRLHPPRPAPPGPPSIPTRLLRASPPPVRGAVAVARARRRGRGRFWPTSSRCGSRLWRRPKRTRAPIGRCSRARRRPRRSRPGARRLLLEVARLVEAEGDADGARRGGTRGVRGGSVAARSRCGACGACWRVPGSGRSWPTRNGTAAEAVVAAPTGRRARRARARTCWWSGAGCWRIAWSATPTRSRATRRRSRPIPITRARCSRCCSRARAGRRPRSSPTALGGLARRAEGARRAALAIEEARAWRQPPTAPRGRRRGARAGRAHRGARAAGITALPLGTVLGRARSADRARTRAPDVAARALAEIAGRAAAVDRELAVALWRERARAAGAAGWTRRPKRSRRWKRRPAWTRRIPSSRWTGCSSSRRWRAARPPMRWRPS